jgi:hypothetical protein
VSDRLRLNLPWHVAACGLAYALNDALVRVMSVATYQAKLADNKEARRLVYVELEGAFKDNNWGELLAVAFAEWDEQERARFDTACAQSPEGGITRAKVRPPRSHPTPWELFAILAANPTLAKVYEKRAMAKASGRGRTADVAAVEGVPPRLNVAPVAGVVDTRLLDQHCKGCGVCTRTLPLRDQVRRGPAQLPPVHDRPGGPPPLHQGGRRPDARAARSPATRTPGPPGPPQRAPRRPPCPDARPRGRRARGRGAGPARSGVRGGWRGG